MGQRVGSYSDEMTMILPPLTNKTRLQAKVFLPINHHRVEMAIYLLQNDRKTLESKRGMPQREGYKGRGQRFERPTHACAGELLWAGSESKPATREESNGSDLPSEGPYTGPALRC
jgi:hypothetical protein